MCEIIAREEMEHNLMQLGMHGIQPDKIKEIRDDFERQFKSGTELKKDDKNTLNRLRGFTGFHFGKRNTTKVIR